MWLKFMKKPLVLAIGLVVLIASTALACGGAAPPPTPVQQAATGGALLAAHKAGETHQFQPKRLEAVIEIDMNEFSFANPQGERNPTFRLPAGKTVGIHVHNAGAIVHELAIGRTHKEGEYQQVLTELVPSDLFFYYGSVKAEVEDATFGELEVDTGVRDIWLRMKIPAEMKGEWEIGCFVEGHYEQGMKAKLIVE
jgi:uncharacterized cupredoxin-like copper-binding protein